MSNQVTVSRVRVLNKNNTCVLDAVWVQDDYISELFPLDSLPEDDLELLRLVREKAQTEDKLTETKHLLQHLKETKRGLIVANTWYAWDQVKEIL